MEHFKNTLWTRDNLEVLHGLNSDFVDLIYLDPPFNSKRLYSAPIGSKAAGVAFKDTWTWSDVDEAYLERLVSDYPSVVRLIETAQVLDKSMAAYLTYMAQRVIEMRRILKQGGSLYLHCDPTASHYLKLMLDGIFGHKCYRNEIIWHYSGWNKKLADKFESRHDTLLFYTKKNNSSNFNGFSIPWKDEAEYIKTRKQKVLVDENGDKYVLSDAGNGKRVKRYIKEAMGYGSPIDDVWALDKINNSSKEKTGYPTQKPLTLLRRIIEASSGPDDIVLDPFCGCATACVAAQQLQRRWIGIDIEEKATDILIDRLSNDAGLFSDFIHRVDVPQRTDISIEPISTSVKNRLFVIQTGKCAGCGKDFDVYNLEVDHIVPKAKGGGDYFENYQLLCGSCNRIKGARPMEYLRTKIHAREVLMKQITFGI